jgi:hypothetical protein
MLQMYPHRIDALDKFWYPFSIRYESCEVLEILSGMKGVAN